jgi:cbb3-type cytochrome oxidase maturation protein
MNAIYLLIPLSLAFLGLAIWAFIWATKTRQFDDMETPAFSILLDDTKASPSDDKNQDG